MAKKKRDKQAAYLFFNRLITKYGIPKYIVTDKAPSIKSALNKLHINQRQVKYLNNRIESDHRFIKKRIDFYKSLRSASSAIKGMEVMYALYKENKKKLSLYTNLAFLPCKQIGSLLDVP